MAKKPKIVYLFDTKADLVKISQKSLMPNFKDSTDENFRSAMIRRKINDFAGCIQFLDKCIEQDPTFRQAYLEKFFIYIDLNQFDNAMLNFFKSSLIDIKLFGEKEPTIYKLIYDAFPSYDKTKREKIRDYLVHYEKILKTCQSYNEFAQKLVDLHLFHLTEDVSAYDDYSNFIYLTERKATAESFKPCPV